MDDTEESLIKGLGGEYFAATTYYGCDVRDYAREDVYDYVA